MNGHAHVASFLLSQGVNADQQEISGNTALHCAVGYSWYFCMKILLDARVYPSVSNEWKVKPGLTNE